MAQGRGQAGLSSPWSQVGTGTRKGRAGTMHLTSKVVTANCAPASCGCHSANVLVRSLIQAAGAWTSCPPGAGHFACYGPSEPAKDEDTWVKTPGWPSQEPLTGGRMPVQTSLPGVGPGEPRKPETSLNETTWVISGKEPAARRSRNVGLSSGASAFQRPDV